MVIKKFYKMNQSINSGLELINIVGRKYIELKKMQNGTEQIRIQPSTEIQIKKILEIANKYFIPVYPISRGRNYGYSLKIESSQYILIDLSRMNKILDFNEKLGYVTIQPGVTYIQLEKFLKRKKSNLFISTTGSFQDSSLLAHAIERGIGKGEYGNSFDYTCSYKIILATGEIVYTDYLKYKNAKSSKTAVGGSGPLLKGLFTQSNLGIVTELTLFLQKKPKYIKLISYFLKTDQDLIKFINIIHQLKQEGLIVGNSLLANTYRILSGATQYPWKDTQETPLKKENLENLTSNWEWKGNWYGNFIIGSNYKNIIKLHEKVIIKQLKKTGAILQVIDQDIAQLISDAKQKSGMHKNWSLDNVYYDTVIHPLNNAQHNIKMLYWRKKIPVPKKPNPAEDKCGILWINTELPFRSLDVVEVNKLATEVLIKWKFEPNIGFNFISERSLICTICIIFDAEIVNEITKAELCRKDLLNKLALQGYFPYRNGNLKDLHVFDKNGNKLINKIKKLLDPHNILAPQRNN